MSNSQKKADQLGMPHGTANSKLHKALLFHLIKQLNQNYCFQCGFEIESKNELSVEHKVPYLDSENPVKLFFDLDNIAFSHTRCNYSAARREEIHGSSRYSKKGCRCDSCVAAKSKAMYEYRHK